MQINQAYWNHISDKLAAEHPERKPPKNWTKSEAQSFLNKLQNKTSKSISTTTFRRIFKEGQLGKVETKDIFAQYFDYPTYGDYIKEEIKQKKSNRLKVLVPTSLLLLGILFFLPKMLKTVNPKKSNIKEGPLIKTIEQSVNYQFSAFKSIPNYQAYIDSLELVYHKEGPAYKEILNILEGQSERNWIINNKRNASIAKLLSLKIDSVNNKQAHISTTEHWRLDWFNPAAQRYEYKYEATNEQQYLLTKGTSDTWKILQNSYSSNKFRYIPTPITCESIKGKITTIKTVKEEVRKAIENDGLDLAFKILVCFYSQNGQTTMPDEFTLLLAEKTKLLRAVNTDEINREKFEAGKLRLFEKLLVFSWL